MSHWLHVLAPASTEIFLLIMVCVIMLIDIFLADTQRWVTYLLTQVTLIVAGIITWHQWGQFVVALDGQFVLDNMAVVLKEVALLMAFAIFMYARVYTVDNNIMRGEFHILGLLCVVGSLVLISANSLLTLYLGLELLSLPLYAMVAMRRDNVQSAEAAMKYFIMGGVASGIFLFGVSLIYGLSKTILLPEMVAQLHGSLLQHPALLFALALVIVAIAFKFGAVPFHMWVPDVYQGAPTSVTAFIGTVPKLAAFALFARLIWHGMAQDAQYWTQIVQVLAILSLLFGNVLAVVQKNLKRLLAYSTVANVGFIFLGFVTNNVFGLHAAMFYTITYVVMAVGAFGLLIILSHRGIDCDRFEDLAGLNARNSGLAFMMTLILLSLAGIPPLVGFTAKLMIISNLINLHHYSLAIFALLMSVVGAYYYLRVVKLMYFDQPTAQTRISNSVDGATALAINGAIVLLAGLFPAALLQVIQMTVH